MCYDQKLVVFGEWNGDMGSLSAMADRGRPREPSVFGSATSANGSNASNPMLK